MLSLFNYYSDYSSPIRELPGSILFRNCTCDKVNRIAALNFSENHRWQCNRPLSSFSFEGMTITGARIPLYLYGGTEAPVQFSMSDCTVGFTEPVEQMIYAGNWREISLRRVAVSGVVGAAVKSWDKGGSLHCEEVTGIEPAVEYTDEVWSFPSF